VELCNGDEVAVARAVFRFVEGTTITTSAGS